ncbi:unnamed protein product [Clonostachys chloroleuca]|uniref:Uncharacterized protein n=1 Tax=Clonostachys chloroleuca TaxID=1926264 RepID=A0AA35PV65_9HYPO|nr:unnamed protein product [Clonostachys chloroleuca]
MSRCRCYIVPPHLLRGIADSASNPDHIRHAAAHSLASRERVTIARKDLFTHLTTPRGYFNTSKAPARRRIVPDALLRHVADSDKADETTRSRARRDLEHLQQVLGRVRISQAGLGSTEQKPASDDDKGKDKDPKESFYRAVHDAKHSFDESELPGQLIRSEGEPDVKDKAVNQVFGNIGVVFDFYKEHFNWHSIDNKNMDVISTVHFGENYENAFWDPEKVQMVFGDGGEFLNNFTSCIDVIGHELTHAVTEHTSPLDYFGMPGALNEHISDVVGIMVKQQVQNENAKNADWLIGEDCILPGVKGTALRSMKAPGSAYDDPKLGKDPQVDHMDQYKTMYEDNGGVHIYSGIPNKAFYLASVAFDGYSWEKAGQIWWKTMTSGKIPPKCSFKQFATVTIEVAEEAFGKPAADKVRNAWLEVGVGSSDGGDSKNAPKSSSWCNAL